MKRAIALAACLVAALSPHALHLSFGSDISYAPRWERYAETAGEPRVSRSELVFGAFLDAEYLLLEVYYAKGMGDETTVTTVAGEDVATSDDNGYSAYQLGLLAMYPVSLAGWSFTPMCGARLRFGTGDDENTRELLFAAGLGVELPVAENMYIRPRALASFPLHANPVEPSGYVAWGLDLGLSIGFYAK